MFWKKKTPEPVAAPEPPKHNHIWKDYPWILIEDIGTYHPNGRITYTYKYRIVEYYLCLTCKELKEKTLISEEFRFNSKENRDTLAMEIRKKYEDKCKPEVEVKDMLYDDMYIDKEALYWYNYLHNAVQEGKHITLKLDDKGE